MSGSADLDRVKVYEVYGEGVEEDRRPFSYLVSARSPGSARYLFWLSIGDAFADWNFGDALKRLKMRAKLGTWKPPEYSYVRMAYGLVIEAGDRVLANGEAAVVAAPSTCTTGMVTVFLANRGPAIFHPSEISR